MRPLVVLLLLTASAFASRMDALSGAIAKAEGFYVRGSISARCNNPGDLKIVQGWKYPGQVGVCKGGHVRFKSAAAGWAALRHQLEKIVTGESRYTVNMSIKDISKKYAGNSRLWSDNVSHNLGVDKNSPLWEYFDVPPAFELSWGEVKHGADNKSHHR